MNVIKADVCLPSCEDLLARGRQAFARLDMALAQRLGHEAEGLCEAAPGSDLHRRCAAAAAELQADAAWAAGDAGATFAAATRAAKRHEQAGERAGLVRCLSAAAVAACYLGLPEDALALAQQGLGEASAIPQLHEQLPQALGTLAHVQASLGQYADAELLHLQALSRARECADPHALSRAYTNALLAGAMAQDELRSHGLEAQAQAMAQGQLRLAFQARACLSGAHMNPTQRANLHLALGLALMNGDRLDEAQRTLDQGMALLEGGTQRRVLDALHFARADCALRAGDPALARRLLEPLLAPSALAANDHLRAPLLRGGLRLYLALGEEREAQMMRASLAMLERDRAQLRQQASGELRTAQRTASQALQTPF